MKDLLRRNETRIPSPKTEPYLALESFNEFLVSERKVRDVNRFSSEKLQELPIFKSEGEFLETASSNSEQKPGR